MSTKSVAASRSASSSARRNPWKEFAENYNRGDKVSGQIKSITDFGIFIGLPGNIDGLVHLSDISWDMPGEEAVRNYQKGQQLEAMVLSIDPERERISLGVKQLAKDPFSGYHRREPQGQHRPRHRCREVDARGAVIDLGNGVEGQLRASELAPRPRRGRAHRAEGRRRDRSQVHRRGPQDAHHLAVDQGQGNARRGRSGAELSLRRTVSSGTSLGDLLKEQIGGDERFD